MRTADLFSRHSPDLSTQIADGGSTWLRSNRASVLAFAAMFNLVAAAESAIAADLSEVRTLPQTKPVVDLTVVIPCHNYARYLGDLLQSLKQSSVWPARVIVVDDFSHDNPELIAKRFGADFIRIEAGNQAKACAAGFASVTTKFVAFVDADDRVDVEYFRSAIAQLEADPAAAFVYPWLEAFGDATGPRHGTENAPAVIHAADIESRNWCPAGSVYRSQILRQSLAMKRERDPLCICNDWITARNVLRAGSWKALKAQRPLHYRIHHGQDHTSRPGVYANQADLINEVVTIVVAFSGRWLCWERLRNWLKFQTWPASQTRLLILNSTHEHLTPRMLDLQDWTGASLQIERIDVGHPGLADIERRGAAPEIPMAVEAAVAGLYNAAVQMVRGELMLVLEDDTIPGKHDTIARLMRHMGPRVAAVSGLYRHRYEQQAVAFNLAGHVAELLPLEGPDLCQVDGSGFGCLLARRSVLAAHPLAGDSPRKFYDVDIGFRLKAAGWQWLLDRSVQCEHLIDWY